MIGTEGQLGLVTEVELETVENYDVTYVFMLLPRWEDDFKPHLEVFKAVQAFRTQVRACEFIDSNSLSYLPPEKTRAFLAKRGKVTANFLAAALGIVTPFCSCSAVPLFLGAAGAGFEHVVRDRLQARALFLCFLVAQNPDLMNLALRIAHVVDQHAGAHQ